MKIKLSPHQILIAGFTLAILTGTILLTLPISSSSGRATPFIDALFTATSSVCVTGLIVVNTATHYSLFGKLIILFLIQIGGLGIMTFSTLLSLLIGKQITLREKIVQAEALNKFTFGNIVNFTLYIFLITLIFESIGAVILSFCFIKEFGLLGGVFRGIFHSVSAFCNAGFSIFPTNLTNYVHNLPVNLTITTLIILGGIGYIVLDDIYYYIKTKQISVHTKLTVLVTLILIFIGTLTIFLLENNNPNTIGNFTLKDKILSSYFSSVTPRTAGFNTLDFSSMRIPTILFIMLLMFIGASPGGTGGGIKTTTFGVIIISVLQILKGEKQVNLFNRKIPEETVKRAFILFSLAISWIFLISFILSIFENQSSLRICFEVISALGTVGLSIAKGTSLSLSSMFTWFGKLLIIITMFFGRLGPLTIGLAIAYREDKVTLKYPEERISIG